MTEMIYSQTGLQLTESFESLSLKAYWDATGKVWTIGYGHTGKEVVEGLVWTTQQCIDALSLDILKFSKVVNTFVNPQLNQHQFDALVDFTFNVGIFALFKSTLLKDVNLGNMQGADAQFAAWVKSGGKVLSGLVRRRLAEATLFME